MKLRQCKPKSIQDGAVIYRAVHISQVEKENKHLPPARAFVITKNDTDDPEKMKLSELLYEAADQLAGDGNLFQMLLDKALALEAAATTSEWISCKDRLPEDDTAVLVRIQDGDRTYEDVWTYDANYDRQWRDGTVIHWMPLPDPPSIPQGEEQTEQR